MDNANFLGMYRLKDQQRPEAMPAQNESGLWQAWRMPDGNIMIQALHWDHQPWGGYYLMSEADFSVLLGPLAAAGESAPVNTALLLRPDSPDLLTLWYEQSVSGDATQSGEAGMTPAPSFAPPLSAGISMAAPRASMAPDEIVLTPVEHPDDLFFDDSLLDEPLAPAPPPRQTPFVLRPGSPTAQAGAIIEEEDLPLPELPVRPQPTAKPAPVARPAPPVPAPAPPKPAAPSPPAGNKHSLAMELQAKRQEDHMREEFGALIERMGDTPDPELEERMTKIVSQSGAFSWKQKFMFTEFGLALRRKRKNQLALLCHLRALHYAPNDEHILFNVARAEYELGNIETAVANLKQALAVDPEFTMALNFLTFLRGKAVR